MSGFELRITNDGKGKSQSFEARAECVLSPIDSFTTVDSIGYGADEKEAKHSLKVGLLKAVAEIHKFVETLECK